MGESDAGMPRKEIAFLLLAGIFLVSLIVANLITAKLFVLAGVVLTVGIIPYPVTFLCTDLISEVYGKKRANAVVWVGLILSLYTLVILQLGHAAEPFEGLNRQGAYETMFGSGARAIIASMVAYLFAQLIDVRLFHFWKKLTGGKHLWLRNNGSTLLSQAVDTVLVVTILFYGQLPNGQLIDLMLASYAFKLVIALIDTPLFYFGERYLTPVVFPDRSRPGRQQRNQDLLLVAAVLGAITVLVGAAIRWSEAGYGWSLGTGKLAIAGAAAVMVALTVALANPGKARVPALIGSAVGASLVFLGWSAGQDHSGAGPVVIMSGAAVIAAFAALAALSPPPETELSNTELSQENIHV